VKPNLTKRRLNIACAIDHAPKLLIMDEFTLAFFLIGIYKMKSSESVKNFI